MPTYDSTDIIKRLLASATKRIRDRFLLIVLQLKSENSLRSLAEMLAVGDVDGALEMLDAAGQRLATTVNSIFIGTGEAVADEMSDALGLSISFNQANDQVVEILEKNALELVTNFTSEQREATRQALIRGARAGDNPRVQAKAFRDSIGLTKNQEQWVWNYRDQLERLDSGALDRALRDGRFDRTVANAIAEQKPLTKEQVNTMVERYRQRVLKYRSEVIARNEAIGAVNQGHDETIRQAVDSKLIPKDDIQRTWKTAHDDRVRDPEIGAQTSHRTMHNQVRAFGQPFESGAGNLLLYPGDPAAPPEDTIQCRCVVATRIRLSVAA